MNKSSKLEFIYNSDNDMIIDTPKAPVIENKNITFDLSGLKKLFPTDLNPGEDKKILVISLFSGIGGIEYGLKKVIPENHKIILFVEKDKNAKKIFCNNFDPNHRIKFINNIHVLDVKSIAEWIQKKYPYNNTIIVTAGFPCTTFSWAGNKQGLLDKNTKAMFEKMVALLEALHSTKKNVIFFMENVTALLAIKNKPFFKIMKEKLSCHGKFHISEKVFDSIDFGVPQHRRRLYLIATNMPFKILIPELLPHQKNNKKVIQDILVKVNDREEKLLYVKHPLHPLSQKILKERYAELKEGKILHIQLIASFRFSKPQPFI